MGGGVVMLGLPLPGRPRRCSHPHCRTSLDEYPTECPHGRPFCEHCTWEDGCSLCNVAATAWDSTPPTGYIDPNREATVDAAAELRAEERAYELARLQDREEAS